MNPTFEQQVNEALAHVNLRDTKTIQEAADLLLGQNSVKVGDSVAVIDDPTFAGFDGQKGKVKSLDKVGYALVEFLNGSEVYLQLSLLAPI